MTAKQLRCLIPNSWVRNGEQLHVYNPLWIVNGSRSGVAVQGWRRKIKEGRNATSPYSLDACEMLRSTAANFTLNRKLVGSPPTFPSIYEDSWKYAGYAMDASAYGADFYAHTASVSSSAEAAALTKVYDRIRQDAYKTNGLLFVGELAETIHMLRHPLDAAHKATSRYLDALTIKRAQINRNVRRRKSDTGNTYRARKLQALKDSMSGSWLELQFGWKPAISDAKDIVGAAISLLSGENRRRSRIVGKSPVVKGAFEQNSTGLQITNLQTKVTWRRYTEADVRYIVGLSHSLDGPGDLLDQVRRSFGFQIQNFVPTVYELIPYSFLIDYFVNLGDIVEAACTDTSGVTWICRTERQRTLVTVDETSFGYDESWSSGTWHIKSLTGDLSSHRSLKRTTFTRTNPPSLSIPPLVVSVPGIESTKWFNMAALLVSARDFRFRR